MDKNLRKRHDAQKRAHGVGTGNREYFDATSGGQKTLATLGSTVADVEGLGTEQEQARIDRQDASADCQKLIAGDRAIGVLEGILVNAPDAPDGALVQLRQAKRIGPRVKEAPATASPTPAPTATPEPKVA